jgi:hypothetical protein
VQTLLPQSAPLLQRSFVSHFSGQEPPQSVSVSLPLRTPSLQVAAWQT